MRRRNLVITRAGSQSLHERWLLPECDRNFDVIVASYVETKATDRQPGVTTRYIPGKKVEGWQNLIEKEKNLIDDYEQIAFIDDDIDCRAADISLCFDLGNKFELSIWQPSLSWSSYFTYAGFLNNPAFLIRYVNYIEMMCPFFDAKALGKVKPLFSLGWESGIDLIWCSILSRKNYRYAIIDEVQVTHTRPVGLNKAANGFIGRNYEDDIYACLRHFEMKWPSLVAEAALLKNGLPVSKFDVSMRLPMMLGSLTKTPNERALRLLTDHFRHQILRTPSYGNRADQILSQSIKNSGVYSNQSSFTTK